MCSWRNKVLVDLSLVEFSHCLHMQDDILILKHFHRVHDVYSMTYTPLAQGLPQYIKWRATEEDTHHHLWAPPPHICPYIWEHIKTHTTRTYIQFKKLSFQFWKGRKQNSVMSRERLTSSLKFLKAATLSSTLSWFRGTSFKRSMICLKKTSPAPYDTAS